MEEVKPYIAPEWMDGDKEQFNKFLNSVSVRPHAYTLDEFESVFGTFFRHECQDWGYNTVIVWRTGDTINATPMYVPVLKVWPREDGSMTWETCTRNNEYPPSDTEELLDKDTGSLLPGYCKGESCLLLVR